MFTGIYSWSKQAASIVEKNYVSLVLCFHHLRMHIANDTYHVRTYKHTYASSTMSRHSGAETKMLLAIVTGIFVMRCQLQAITRQWANAAYLPKLFVIGKKVPQQFQHQ